MIPSSHLCRPLLLLPSIFPSIRVFSNESVLCIRWPKYWSFSFSISPSNEHSGLISFMTDWFDAFELWFGDDSSEFLGQQRDQTSHQKEWLEINRKQCSTSLAIESHFHLACWKRQEQTSGPALTGVWERHDQAQTPDRFSWNINQPSPPLTARAACSHWMAPPTRLIPAVCPAPPPAFPLQGLATPARPQLPTSHVELREAPRASPAILATTQGRPLPTAPSRGALVSWP